jgi:anti-sigma regulatory factor (Ser/Thr protein kinase)
LHSLTLRNELAEIVPMTSWIEERAAALGVSPQTAHAVQLCMEEAVTNVISYAFDPGSVHEIRIRLWRDGETVFAEITDDGRQFDPLAYEVAPTANDLASAAIGGLGIKLMRGYTGSMTYQRSGETNRLLMSFRVC